MHGKLVLLILFYLCFQIVEAQLLLSNIFDDNMVLQQESNVAIWGKGIPDSKVSVIPNWKEQGYETTVEKDSTWTVRIATPSASYKKYAISIVSKEQTIQLKNVVIGEVWLCSGQSNMDMRMKGFYNQPINNSLQDIINSSNEFLRCYTLERASASKKQFDCPGSWAIASPNTTGEFTATGYYFARLIQQILDVPVGILHASWGGSTIEAWMSSEAMQHFPQLMNLNNTPPRKTPTLLYNGMMNTIVGYTIRGAIWYQGESNRTRYQYYAEEFKTLHEDWISKWNNGDFPIYFCQIAPYRYGDESDYNSAFMREAQLRIAQTQPLTSMVVLMDVGEEFCIHPANKKQGGERLAYIALAKTYNFGAIPYQSPEYKEIDIQKDKIVVTFNYAGNGLSSFGKPLTDFELAGKDRVFYPARAKIVNTGVEVTSPDVPQPIAVRYAFKDFIKGSLFGTNGLPVSSFRSDTWDDIK